MQFEFVHRYKSIVSVPTSEDVGSFVVLTGVNGSGKSHLLSALEQGAITIVGASKPPHVGVRTFRLSELMADPPAQDTPKNHAERWANIATQIRSWAEQNPGLQPEQREAFVIQNLKQSRLVSEAALLELLDYRDGFLHEFEFDDIREALPLNFEELDPFKASLSTVFGTYYARREQHRQYEYRNHRYNDPTPFLNDEEFAAKYGPPPWELMNDTLERIGLHYEFREPAGIPENVPYQPKLRDRGSGLEVPVEELSTGERTLLSVALALYTGQSDTAELRMPETLLLDEADASLHPEMIQSLLSVIDGVFVRRHSVNVIMTTHSPTTVALAPEQSLYLMQKYAVPRMVSVGRDRALASLTVGLPTLSIRQENRLTVLTEAESDATCYEAVYRRIRNRLSSPFSLTFVPSGLGSENAGSSVEVIRLVQAFRTNGNDRVVGIVDRDKRQGAPDGIVYSSERYSLENHILDPLLVGTLLLALNFRKPEDLGLAENARHFSLDPEQAQLVVDSVSNALGSGYSDAERVATTYTGGFSLEIPKKFIDGNGHEIEKRYVETFEELKRFKGQTKREVVSIAVRDCVEHLPLSVLKLIESLALVPAGPGSPTEAGRPQTSN
ncbi:AAA family ATPase [Actinomycetospora sp. OC33-EN08]|uniref:AAA family ATPase n=1 Tax=Actinomycetospora aurantiaca TaxID=3129233 RepID=A0ABU8MWP8_9PSEU